MKKEDTAPPRTTDDTERAKRRSARIKSFLYATANVATTVATFWALYAPPSKHPPGQGA
jgi:hypothetical protein